MAMDVRRVAILGLGLMGGSLGYALSRLAKPPQIVGYAHRPEVRARARKIGVVDEIHDSPSAAVRGADFVVLCTPVAALEGLLADAAESMLPGAVVTDVGSTKRSIVAAAGRLLPKGVHFVGSHPMAGSEKKGIDFARPDLYDGAACIVTPVAATHPAALASVETFWLKLQCRVHRMDPDKHDEILAYVSHLPHLLAVNLVSIQPEGAADIAAGGFRDMTRIASGDPVMWRDIFLDNRDALRRSIMSVRGELDRALALIDRGDAAELQAYLQAVKDKKQTFGTNQLPPI